MDRRNFFKQSLIASGGLILAPLYVSCSDDDLISDKETSLDETGFKIQNFNQGLASFDPTDSSIILWTRFEANTPNITLGWEIATDSNFENLIKKGTILALSEHDYTVNLDIEGLSSNSKFYYRFFEETTKSITVVGQTITLPSTSDNVNQVKLAVTSCANYAAGLFNTYNAMANSNADVIIHLGDYIYEYGEGEYGTNNYTTELDRVHSPSNEIITINDYRERYKQYRSDKNLQLAHQLKPFICVWDDHEITNDSYKDGAQNHQEDEGSYETRKQIAIQVYSEFIPVRSQNGDPSKIYRSFNFGTLLSLHMLDTRIIGRDEQISFNDYFLDDGSFDFVTFTSALENSNKKMLGDDQFSWLSGVINNSSKWQVLGQQVLMAKMLFPAELLILIAQLSSGNASAETFIAFQTSLTELTAIKLRYLQNDPTLTPEEIGRVTTVAPYNLDAWDGYETERKKVIELFSNKNVINLAGDTHNAWFSDITDSLGNTVATELATSSVTSPGLEQLSGADSVSALGFAQALQVLIDDLKYADTSRRGFLSVTFTSASAEANWNFMDTVSSEIYSTVVGNSVSIPANA